MTSIRAVMLLFLFVVIAGANLFTSARTSADSPVWQPFDVVDEEFAVLTPGTLQKKVSKQRIQNHDIMMNTYTALTKNGGSMFTIASLGGLDNLLSGMDIYSRSRLAQTTFADGYLKVLLSASEADNTIKHSGPLRLGDLPGQAYNFSLNQQFGTAYVYCTTHKIYFAIALSTVRDDPDARRFLASFSLPYQGRDVNGYVPPMLLKYSITVPEGNGNGIGDGPDRDTGGIYSMRQVTKKAQTIRRPNPEYTKRATANKTAGTIRLLVVLCFSGQAKVLGVVKSLPDGLTEEAVRAALKIEFIPAEKDGQLVSQLVTLEYTFSSY